MCKNSGGVFMKKTVFTLCLGMLIGLIIGVSTSSFAAVGDKVEAVFSKFTFKINDEEITLKADPLNYQGSVYLPLRVVANMLGYDVNYKTDSRTIELSSGITTDVTKSMEVGENVSEVVETTYKGLRAVTYNGETYFNCFKDYNDKYQPIQWGFDRNTNTISLVRVKVVGNGNMSTEIEEIYTQFNKDEPGALLIHKGASYINTRYYQEVPIE